MTKKLIYGAMCAVLSVSLIATSCSKDDDYVSNKTLEKSKVSSKVAISDCEQPENYNEFVSKLNEFAAKFAGKISASTDMNFAVSPLSAFMVMAMASESSNGNTQAELLNALGMTQKEINDNIRYLSYMSNRTLGNDYMYESNENLIKSVNSIWVNDYVDLKDDCMSTLSNNYSADLFRVDFSGDKANKMLTSYINKETDGFLPDVDLEISSSARMVLMNVLYLKDLWNTYGDDLYLTDKSYDFKNSDGSVVNGQLLSGTYRMGKAVETEKFKRFYTSTNGGIKLTFIVPNDGYTVSDIYTSDILSCKEEYDYGNDSVEYYTRCFFPEFSASFDDDIMEVLVQLGVNDFFEEGICDFSNLTDESVYCSKVKHVTKLEVSKTGIEGAAVTAAEMDGQGDAGNYEEVKRYYYDFIVDKAFVFVVSNYYTGQLFTGIVNKI